MNPVLLEILPQIRAGMCCSQLLAALALWMLFNLFRLLGRVEKGAVFVAENVRALRQNGLVLFIDRPLEALTVGGGRPLSSSPEALRKMEAERRPLYERAADAAVPNDGTVEQAAARALETLNKLFAQ